MKNQNARIALTRAHRYMKDAMEDLTYATDQTKDDEFANPIVKAINEQLLDVQKKLTIIESYAMFTENGLEGPKYDGVFEQMWDLYKQSTMKRG